MVASAWQSATLLLLATVHTPLIIIPALLLSGFCWTSAMSTLNVSVQLAIPEWIKARALGTYLMTFQGGLALGSILWGYLAEHASTAIALSVASAGLLLSIPLTMRYRILRGPMPDHTPYQWTRPALEPLPAPGETASLTEGPVRVSIEYEVSGARYAEFVRAIYELRGVRLRDGAIRWGIFRDATNPEKLNETFVMESWLDYLRSRERVTAADRVTRDRVFAMHRGPEPPRITHGIFAREVSSPDAS